MKTTIEVITPDIAKQMLDRAGPNRCIRPGRVAELVSMMKKGQFFQTHQGIAFDTLGRLRDGQHRLHAIIQSGCTVSMQVTYGVDDGSFLAIDMGATRKLADILRPGEVGAKDLCELAGCAIRLTAVTSSRVCPSDAQAILETHQNKFQKVFDACSTKSRGLSVVPIRLAAAHSADLHGQFSLDAYRCLVLGHIEQMRPVTRAFYKQILHGTSSQRRKQGTTMQLDLYCRGMVAFDPSKMDLSKIQLSDTRHFVESLRKWIFG